jgi:hypothetical protein
MKYKHFLFITIVASISILGQCKKGNTPVSPNISLTNKTEQEVRSLISGKWNLLYTINPNPPYYNQIPNSFWEISASDSITEVYNNQLYAKSKFKLERIRGNDQRWKLTSADGSNSFLDYTLDSLRTDTLISYYEWTGSMRVLKKQ